MRKVAIYSVKGGVGKSTVSAGLCYALRDRGYRVGYQEVDTSGTSGHKAFGLEAAPRLELDTANCKMIPPLVDGIRLFCLASKFDEDSSVCWPSAGSKRVLSTGEEVINDGRRGFIQEILTLSVDWKDTEWIVYDLPPSSNEDTFAYFDFIQDLKGVIIVSQPSAISVVGLKKTLDLLKTRTVPILGIVENMAYFLTPDGRQCYPFVSQRVNLKELATKMGVSYLVSIPQVDAMSKLKPYFQILAGKAIEMEGKVKRQEVLSTWSRLSRNLIKLASRPK